MTFFTTNESKKSQKKGKDIKIEFELKFAKKICDFETGFEMGTAFVMSCLTSNDKWFQFVFRQSSMQWGKATVGRGQRMQCLQYLRLYFRHQKS